MMRKAQNQKASVPLVEYLAMGGIVIGIVMYFGVNTFKPKVESINETSVSQVDTAGAELTGSINSLKADMGGN